MSAPSASRMPFIDALRAVAIVTVFFRHLPPELGVSFGKLHEWGGRGVDLFFILSGFLIGTTALERAEQFSERRVRQAGAYWVLRSARIFPFYFSLLALFAIGAPFIHPDVTHVIRNFSTPFLTFTSNFFAQGTLELGIYWSLAIEEQFYLAVGLLVLASGRRRDTLGAAFLGLALMAVAVSIFHRSELFDANANKSLEDKWYVFALFHGTLARMDQLALGLTLSVFAPWFNGTRVGQSPRQATLVSWAGVAFSIAVIAWFPHRPVIGFTVLGVLLAVSVLLAQRPVARATPVQARRVLAVLGSLGRLSFGLYLLHPLVRPAAERITSALGLPTSGLSAASAFLVIWVGLTWLIAATSYRFFEEPVLALGRRVAKRLLGPPTPVTAPAAAEPTG